MLTYLDLQAQAITLRNALERIATQPYQHGAALAASAGRTLDEVDANNGDANSLRRDGEGFDPLSAALAETSAARTATMYCVVCNVKTPHRLLRVIDDALEMWQCGVCGTTNSKAVTK
jgi:hypothetical protein